jgi:hypothetical protein
MFMLVLFWLCTQVAASCRKRGTQGCKSLFRVVSYPSPNDGVELLSFSFFFSFFLHGLFSSFRFLPGFFFLPFSSFFFQGFYECIYTYITIAGLVFQFTFSIYVFVLAGHRPTKNYSESKYSETSRWIVSHSEFICL